MQVCVCAHVYQCIGASLYLCICAYVRRLSDIGTDVLLVQAMSVPVRRTTADFHSPRYLTDTRAKIVLDRDMYRYLYLYQYKRGNANTHGFFSVDFEPWDRR